MAKFLSELTRAIRIVRRDKAVKVILTTLCITSFALGIWWPYLTVHGTVLSFITNMLWLWEA